MGASVSYKLKNSLQGALAGGGDPATSPLYVFGPFLSLIVGAGVASITFGASVWMAVFTVISVSAMYRYVMIWITDGSGGSGLSEEEFGGWAVKVNASITVIEYTLTFLVSLAALVTFVSDRIPALASSVGILDLRTVLAIGLSIAVIFAVNKGPKISTMFFGPATALVLLFLWVMIIAVIFKEGFRLPGFDVEAFSSRYIHYTLGGFARILALMTGIEIFANLVASYEGNGAQRSRRAFGSLIIVMGTTVFTMLVVGPEILKLSNPSLTETSVFTQTMDALLPAWLSYAGTFIGIAVLLSAAAASMQGIQNLALGLRARHYIPAVWGQRNKSDVPSIPSWIQGLICIVAFLILGTHEETYLALYAAGVFILLSMTGWSAAKRFFRFLRKEQNLKNYLGFGVSIFSAICATFATLIIFEERFMDGAWSYFVMVPLIYIGFDYFRKKLGPPPQSLLNRISNQSNSKPHHFGVTVRDSNFKIEKILVPLNGDLISEFAFFQSLGLAKLYRTSIDVLFVDKIEKKSEDIKQYFSSLAKVHSATESEISFEVKNGDFTEEIADLCNARNVDLICMASAKVDHAVKAVRTPTIYKVIYETTPPLLLLRPSNSWHSRVSQFESILVPLDGSEISEQVLGYVAWWANQHKSKVTLLHVPEDQADESITQKMKAHLESISKNYFQKDGIVANVIVEGSGPARTILHYLKISDFDLVAMVSHGRGGIERQKHVPLGSVTESVIAESDIPILFISAR